MCARTIIVRSQLQFVAGSGRDRHAAAVIHRRVLAKGHRALICYGLDHVTRGRSVGLHIQLQTG